jgi:riboflavin synthase
MFTGIVSERGRVRRAKARKGVLELEVEAPETAKALHRSDSVSIDGVCLTVVTTSRKRFGVQAMAETLERSSLGALRTGAEVNLELPVRLMDRLGGHLVQGHVDGMATVIRLEDEEASRRLWFSAPPELLRYLVPKGSVTVNGVALTVTEVGVTSFGVAVIPHTLDVTTLGSITTGATANIEVDIIAKYVERLVAPTQRAIGTNRP